MDIKVNERINYIYDECRKVGITHYGAIGLLCNLMGETSDFDPMSLETMYANRFKLTDAEYTRRADAGEKVYNQYTFVKDSAGYGIAQWTWWERKQNLLDFAKSLGKSVGDLEVQVKFMFKEMQSRYTKTWKILTTTDNYEEAVKICVNEYEKPANASTAIKTRCSYFNIILNSIEGQVVETPKEQESVETSKPTTSGITVEKAIAALISWHRSQLGYMEKRSNSQLEDKTANAGSNNYTKYADFIDKNYPNFYNGKKNGFAWCDVYVDCGFIVVFGYAQALKLLCATEKSSGAGCIYSANYYRAKSQFIKRGQGQPQAGDQIFFGSTGNETHTGVVVEVTSTNVITIEGNTSSASGVIANGGMVCEKSYPLDYYYIVGYGRPDYSLVSSIEGEYGSSSSTTTTPTTPTTTPSTSNTSTSNTSTSTSTTENKKEGSTVEITLNTLKQGDKGPQVKTLQRLLIANNYSCGSAKDDGDFGRGTYTGLVNYQRAKGLEPDGICGKNTWNKLLKG